MPSSNTDQICIATMEKSLFFYEFTTANGNFKFEEDKKIDKGYMIACHPL